MSNYVLDMICNYRRQKEIQDKHYKTYLKAKEEEMNNFDKRVAEVKTQNKSYNDWRSSDLYARAFVSGERANEKKRNQEIYNKLNSAGENEREVIILCGRTTAEVAKALEFYDNATLGWTDEERKKMLNRQDENKMTREEAIKKVNNKTPYADANVMVDCLEALGLIKFDEPELELDEKISLKLNKALSTKQVTDVLDMLNHLGYTIEPKGIQS